MLLYGAGLGYEVQRREDSGELIVEKVHIISSAGFCSFLIAFILAILWKKWHPSHLYWISAPIIGSGIFSILFGVVWFTYNSIGHQTASEILSENAGFFAGRIVFQSVFFATPILVLLALLRLVHFLHLSTRRRELD